MARIDAQPDFSVAARVAGEKEGVNKVVAFWTAADAYLASRLDAYRPSRMTMSLAGLGYIVTNILIRREMPREQ